MFVVYNGEFYPADEPLFTGKNRSFRYGDSVFESIRVVNGRPMFLPLHFQRLQEAKKILHYEPTEGFTLASITELILQLLERNQITQGGRIRLTVFRNEGGFYIPETNTKSFLIEAEPYEHNYYHFNEKGLVVDLSTGPVKKYTPLSYFKTGSALFYVLAGVEKNNRRLDELILLNEKFHLCESIHSNLFMVKNNTIYTPSLDDFPVNGIMRSVIIDLARSQKMNVVEGSFSPTALLQADEVFLTNAIQGIRWVGAYRNKRYFHKISTQLNLWLNDLLIEEQSNS